MPAALADVVLGFRSLNNFVLRPRVKLRSVDAPSPQFTSNTSGAHYIAPSDFATIYDLARLYASGMDGRGQTIAIAGQTDILLSDIDTFAESRGYRPTILKWSWFPGRAIPERTLMTLQKLIWISNGPAPPRRMRTSFTSTPTTS